MNNKMTLTFLSLSSNEAFARSVVGAFCTQLNPTLDEVTDVKTAISEAVTNCVVHAYPNEIGEIKIECELKDNTIYIAVSDNGVGVKDIEKVKEPFFTTRMNDERSGMGFTVMESFMDNVELIKKEKGGLTVKLNKKIGKINLKVMGV